MKTATPQEIGMFAFAAVISILLGVYAVYLDIEDAKLERERQNQEGELE
jgi:hypothetical protein